jgi:uncharacterized protein (PEP-CTERM system associated)
MPIAANVPAANWTVRPEITLRETYTDNVFIGVGTPRSDWVTEVTPAIRIDGRSPRLTANLSYAPSAVFYARNNEFNDVINNLDAFGKLEAVENYFFVEAAARINQTFVTPFAPQPGDITLVSPNRLETRTLSFSPYVRHEGSDLAYELRNANTWTNSDSDSLGKFRTDRWTGHVGAPVRRFGWRLEFDHTDISYYDSIVERPEDKSRLYRGRLYYQPDPAWRLSASAGSEENNYVLQQMQQTDIYGATIAWRPSARTSADIEYEKRFFGPSRLVRLNHRTALSSWTVRYSRNTSTYQEEVLRLPPGNTTALLDSIFTARIPDPEQRRTAVEQFMFANGTPAFLANSLAFYTQRVYLREGVDASVAFLGKRNSITFTAFAAESSDISVDVLGLLPDAIQRARKLKQRGFGASGQHSLTPSTSIVASGSRIFALQEQPAELESRNDYFNLSLNHSISPKTIVFTGVSVTRFDTEDPLVPRNQDATSAFVGLNHRF